MVDDVMRTALRPTQAPTVIDPAGPHRRRGRSGFGLLRLQLMLAALAGLLLLEDGGSGGDGGTGDGGSGDGGQGDGGSGSGSDDGSGDDGAGDDDASKAEVKMTQAELDALINKKVGKAKGAAESEFKKWLDDQSADETTKQKNRADEAERKGTERETKANGRLIRAEAKEAALAAKANPDRVNALLKLATLDSIEVDEDGEVDTKAVRKAIDAALKEYPEFKATAGKGGASGGEHGGGSGAKASNLGEAVAAALAG